MKKKLESSRDLDKIVALGKQKGFLTYDEVNDLLPEDISSSEDIDRLFELLGNEDIQVVERQEERPVEKSSDMLKEEMLADQAKSEERFIPLDDPVKMYLKQMGSISLLSREHEIELAKKIEDAEEKFKRAALNTKFVRNHTISVANDILEEKVNLEEVVKEDIKVKANQIIPRIKRILKKIKSTRSETVLVNSLLDLNFVTSVIETAVRSLSRMIRELEQAGVKEEKA